MLLNTTSSFTIKIVFETETNMMTDGNFLQNCDNLKVEIILLLSPILHYAATNTIIQQQGLR